MATLSPVVVLRAGWKTCSQIQWAEIWNHPLCLSLRNRLDIPLNAEPVISCKNAAAAALWQEIISKQNHLSDLLIKRS